MAVLDLETRDLVPIEGATIGYASEAIPDHHLAVSPAGSTVYWATVLPFDGVAQRVQIFRARSDGSGLTQIATLPALLVWFSPDFQKVAYFDSGVLYAAAIDGSGPVQIGPSSMPCCSTHPWRPRP
jgi:hypothetical protein